MKNLKIRFLLYYILPLTAIFFLLTLSNHFLILIFAACIILYSGKRFFARLAEELISTEQKNSQRFEKLKKENLNAQIWRDIFLKAVNLVLDPVLILDSGSRIVHLNDRVSKMFAINEANLVGERISKLLPVPEIESTVSLCLKKKEAQTGNFKTFYPETKEFAATFFPLNDKCILVMEDVTPGSLMDELRKDFVANASHELKTPVSSIKIIAETINSISSSNDNDVMKIKRFSKKLLSEVQNLTRLVSDLLDLSKLENIRPDHKYVSINKIVAECVKNLKPFYSDKKLKIKVDFSDKYQVFGDSLQLKMMVMNLLENAITYTPEKGRVDLGIEASNGNIVLSIADNGIGIPTKDIDRIFERFYRVDKARSRSTGGTGLGLSIVKHIVDNHSGEITIESALGQGSTFKVSLPASDTAS